MHLVLEQFSLEFSDNSWEIARSRKLDLNI